MTELVKIGDKINVDKNIVENINDFSVYGKDEPLVKALLYYIAYQHRYNPEEFGILDPEKFAAVCGFTPNYLRNRHDEPAMLMGLSSKQVERLYAAAEDDVQHKVLDSNLENALYKLMRINMVYQNKPRIYTLKDNKMVQETSFHSFNFIQNLKVAQIKTPSGRSKTIYQYEVTESFINHMGLYYMPCDLQLLVFYRKKRRDDLYLFLVRAREYCRFSKQDQFTSNLDQLCRWANINLTSDREKKRKITATFKDFEEKVDFKFTLQWHRRDGERWEYVPVLYFADIAKEGNSREAVRREKIEVFFNNLVNELGSIYKENMPVAVYGPEYVSGLLQFIQNGECWTEKLNAYIRAEIRSYKNPDQQVRTRASEFFMAAAKRKWRSFNEIKKEIVSFYQNKKFLINVQDDRS